MQLSPEAYFSSLQSRGRPASSPITPKLATFHLFEIKNSEFSEIIVLKMEYDK